MNIETKYSLDENDYLAYQLYAASTNKRIQTNRKKQWAFTAIIFIGLGILFYINHNSFLGNYFIGFAILTFFCFPFYSKWRYKNHYLRDIKDTYQNNFGKVTTLIIKDNILHTSDDTGQSSVTLSQLTEISETGQHFFFKSISGQALMISKNKLDDLQRFTSMVKDLSANLKIKHKIDDHWKWK